MLHGLMQVWFGWVRDGGYWGVIALMAMESSILPVPSEIVIPPAAFWAAQGRMSFAGVVMAGTFGSWLGSAISYWVSRWIGRAVILRWGKLVLITPDKLERAEQFVQRYEIGGVFFARLLPVLRHLISIPAGIARMSFGLFSLVTVLGAGLWCTVLAWFGAKVTSAHPDLMQDPEALAAMMKQEGHWIVAAVLVLCLLYFLVIRLTNRGAEPAADTAD
uniref:DedA n=1 Tax=Solibacter usitatus (strain Ellin6076) TaxID=234267 RepID=Q02CZ6_SOLUE